MDYSNTVLLRNLGHSAVQEITDLLRNPNFHESVLKNPPLNPIESRPFISFSFNMTSLSHSSFITSY
jgi:hypothetical protein